MALRKTKNPVDARLKVVHDVFEIHDTNYENALNPVQIQNLYDEIRLGSLSLPQIEAAISYVCSGDGCEEEELYDLLQEMDRRYFLVQDLRWEFTMLDRNQSNTITEDQAKWFVQCVHGEFFWEENWEKFLRQRPVPGSGVTFAEIEVLLCNIPSLNDLLAEEEARRKALEEQARREKQRRKLLAEQEAKRRKLEEQAEKRRAARRKAEESELAKQLKKEQRQKQKVDDEDKARHEQELEEERQRRAQEEEERRQRELEEERLRAEQDAERLREEEERRKRDLEDANNWERLLKEAIEKEKQYTDEANKLKKLAATDPDAAEAERRARQKAKEWKNKRIRYALKVAIAKRDQEKLPPCVKEFKDNKLSDDDMDLEKAEKILREFRAKAGLLLAMANPQREGLDKHIELLEAALAFIQRNGFEYMFRKEIKEAENLLKQLKKRYKIYAEIMALDQPTVAEIKSYQSPPEMVHIVMMAVFIMLGHKESDMKDWQNVRIWVGKTGKDGLKRRCLEYLKEPSKVIPKQSAQTKKLLINIDLDDVRDVSAGAATFFVWAWTMVEETDMRLAREEYEAALKAEEEKARKAAAADAHAAAADATDAPTPDAAAAAAASDAPASKEETKRKGKETQETFKLTTKGKVRKSKP